VPLPIVLSPIGGPRMFHSDGELAVAPAARHARLPYSMSTLGTQPLEAVAEAAQGSPLWFQLYVWGDRSTSRELVRRARDAGYRVLLLSVDTSVRSERDRELHHGIELPSPRLTVGTVLDGARHPSWSWHFLTSSAISFPNLSMHGPTSREVFGQVFDGTVCWQDLEWIRQEWDGPIAIKGLLRAEDAVRAADHGVDAVIVSNHGGRQLDHVPATLEVLPDIVAAVGDRMEVLLDSGIRRGSDIVTALSLGARAVLIGRAHLYGLAAAGEAGVRHAIDILAKELRMTMALCGATTLADLSPDLLRARGLPQLDGLPLPYSAPERALPGRNRPPAGQLAPRT
jgi:L-lactate dehydrogenase (cytochrome)